jgi:CRP-like cAMP-binding protein
MSIDQKSRFGQLQSERKLIVLLRGIACLYRLRKDGSRQITSLCFPGDICNLQLLNADPNQRLELSALTDGIFGTIDLDFMAGPLEQHPSLGLALWRAAILEMFVARAWLLNVSQKAATERVAHLLCEVLVRQEASGMSDRSILLNQLDIADIVGLSAVHVNRIIQALRSRGVLSNVGHTLEVTDRAKLERIADFHDGYLKLGQIAEWDVKVCGQRGAWN